MQASDILQCFQDFIAEPYQDRFPTAQQLRFASIAQRDVARETRPIQGRRGIATQVGFGEYPLFPHNGIIRVYMSGPGFVQRLTHTSIPQMEGDQLRIYDNSAPNNTPQWMVLPPAPFPVPTALAGIGYSPLPMFPGSRPEYYLRGLGVIGVVPAPLSVYNLIVEHYTKPDEFATVFSPSIFDMDWVEAIAWYMASLAYHSDQSVGSDSLEAAALARYSGALGKMQSLVSNVNEDDPQGPQILTHRSFFYDAGWNGISGGYGAYYDC